MTLIIEAGVPFKSLPADIRKDTRKVVGCIVSHLHGDHGDRIKEYQKRGVDCYYPNDETIRDDKPIDKLVHMGPFTIKPFMVIHDIPCFGYLVRHEESGTFPFITDTHYIPYKFDMDNMMIECNYSESIIRNKVNSGDLHPSLADRIAFSHVSLETCIDFLSKNDLSNVSNIVLLHLSSGNSDAALFKKTVETKTGVPVTIADKGVSIPFNKGI